MAYFWSFLYFYPIIFYWDLLLLLFWGVCCMGRGVGEWMRMEVGIGFWMLSYCCGFCINWGFIKMDQIRSYALMKMLLTYSGCGRSPPTWLLVLLTVLVFDCEESEKETNSSSCLGYFKGTISGLKGVLERFNSSRSLSRFWSISPTFFTLSPFPSPFPSPSGRPVTSP